MAAVITGAGCVSGFGIGMQALEAGFDAGTRAFTPWETSVGIMPQLVCRVPLPDSADDLHSRGVRLALLAAKEAIAGLSPEERANTGVIVGGTTGGLSLTETCLLEGAPFDARMIIEHPVSATTNAIAQRLGLGGPRTTVITACASGLTALIMAKRWVDSGQCQRVLAVGTDALCRLTIGGFSSLAAIDPNGMRPFQADRRGVTLGEGAAAFVVEQPGKRPTLAKLLGAAIVAEAHHPTHPEASGEGAERATRLALSEAGVTPAHISLISAHGTATVLNDASEVKAMHRVFGERTPIASHKSQLGHTLGAAGALETAVCLLMFRRQVLFPTYGLVQVADDCLGVDHVTSTRQAPVTYIVKNSFAFGGQNSTLILGHPEC